MPQKSRPTRAQGVDSARPQSRRGQNATSGKRGQLCGFAVLRDHFTLVSSVLSARVVVRRPLGREAGKKEKLKCSFTSLLNSSRRASEGEAVLSPGRLGTSVPRAAPQGNRAHLEAVGDLPKAPGSTWGCKASQHPLSACHSARQKVLLPQRHHLPSSLISYPPWETELATSCRLVGARARGHIYRVFLTPSPGAG